MSHNWFFWPMPASRMGCPLCCASGSESRSIAPAWRNAIRTFWPTIFAPSKRSATWLAAVTRAFSTINMASADESINACNCGCEVMADTSKLSVASGLTASAGISSCSCGSTATNKAISIDTKMTSTRSADPAIWPANMAPTNANANATRIRGDNQLFTS